MKHVLQAWSMGLQKLQNWEIIGIVRGISKVFQNWQTELWLRNAGPPRKTLMLDAFRIVGNEHVFRTETWPHRAIPSWLSRNIWKSSLGLWEATFSAGGFKHCWCLSAPGETTNCCRLVHIPMFVADTSTMYPVEIAPVVLVLTRCIYIYNFESWGKA